jgi:hypothetical protein
VGQTEGRPSDVTSLHHHAAGDTDNLRVIIINSYIQLRCYQREVTKGSIVNCFMFV